MGSHTIYSILCIALLATHIVNTHGEEQGEVWNFGNPKIPGSIFVVHNEGYMGFFEHTKNINLSVSCCCSFNKPPVIFQTADL